MAQRFPVLLAALLLAACGKEPTAAADDAPSPMADTTATKPATPEAPDASAVQTRADAPDDNANLLPASALDALRGAFDDDIGELRYFARPVDLNGDGIDEIVAYVVGPMVCGTGGCSTFVLERSGDDYRVMSSISVTHPPILAARSRSHDWRDLVVTVSGGGIAPGFVRVTYDGSGYANNPTTIAARPMPTAPDDAELLIGPFERMQDGALLVPAPDIRTP